MALQTRRSGTPEKVLDDLWNPSRSRLGSGRARKMVDDHEAVYFIVVGSEILFANVHRLGLAVNPARANKLPIFSEGAMPITTGVASA
jgi:hypothetical protein